jgi:nitric oxide dioxygenase
MTPQQIVDVRASWADAEPAREALASAFYTLLFARSPAMRAQFTGDMQAQGAKLVATLNVVVAHLDDLSPLAETLAQLGVRHLAWHVTASQYDEVGDALMGALGKVLGARFTPALEAAWRAAYDEVAQPMKRAAYPPDGPPAGPVPA